VAAVNSAGVRASFSQQNSSVIVAAPGVDVIGAGPDGQYIDGDGTSPSAALVSGVAALILARYPGLSPARERLQRGHRLWRGGRCRRPRRGRAGS
jgi:subtilisin family serine protease